MKSLLECVATDPNIDPALTEILRAVCPTCGAPDCANERAKHEHLLCKCPAHPHAIHIKDRYCVAWDQDHPNADDGFAMTPWPGPSPWRNEP